ncbi:MAG: hypothetical protein AAGF12_12495 [Myxococcota bacterium]
MWKGEARNIGLASFALLTVFAIDPSVASARRGVVIFGGGEDITHIEEADASAVEQLLPGTDPNTVAIGYHHEYFSLFFLNVLTFEGEGVVLYEVDGDEYWLLEDEDILALTGESREDLGSPFLYKFPGGCFFFTLLLLGYLVYLFGFRLRQTSW